jgi:hypothetical protein
MSSDDPHHEGNTFLASLNGKLSTDPHLHAVFHPFSGGDAAGGEALQGGRER